MPERFYWEAIRDTLAEEMRANEKVFLMGEDIGVWGGAYAATKGLLDEFGPERVRDTPISEMAITGAAVGAAMCGYRPVVEIQYMDFLTLAMDQLVNQAAKNRYMFGGKTTVPLVLRTQGGAGRSIAAQHSQSLEAWFVHVPGLLIATPSTPYDAKGLLRTALREEENPVLFLEHKMLYGTKGEVPDGDFSVPFGVAAVRRTGKDVTVVSYGRMANTALAACEQLAKDDQIDAEMIDLRTLKPFDLVAVLESVKKTGRVLLCSEAVKTGNFVCELAMRINEHAFDDLDAPVRRVCALDVPVPMSPVLEAEAIPSQERIAQAVRSLIKE
ncbi:MAG TPA: alpha-ketoacid dehydrogenase subunit beta [Planctomycetota bacterium]|nr:alpha-ketoacid dehydrogenase subunit beta [Planctomycetota bacterium]